MLLDLEICIGHVGSSQDPIPGRRAHLAFTNQRFVKDPFRQDRWTAVHNLAVAAGPDDEVNKGLVLQRTSPGAEQRVERAHSTI